MEKQEMQQLDASLVFTRENMKLQLGTRTEIWQRNHSIRVGYRRTRWLTKSSYDSSYRGPTLFLWLVELGRSPIQPLRCPVHDWIFHRLCLYHSEIAFHFACSGDCFVGMELAIVVIEYNGRDWHWGMLPGHFHQQQQPPPPLSLTPRQQTVLQQEPNEEIITTQDLAKQLKLMIMNQMILFDKMEKIEEQMREMRQSLQRHLPVVYDYESDTM
jgi:hypothetical protein